MLLVFEEGLERRALGNKPVGGRIERGIRRVLARREAARRDRMYVQVGTRAAAVVVISDSEREWFRRLVPGEKLYVVPHGVDCSHYAPADSTSEAGTEDIDIAIFGNLGEHWNADAAAAVYQAAQGMTEKRQWALVGRGSDRLHQRLGAPPDLLATGYVDDLRPYYRRSRVVLVPSAFHTGVKTTVLQAWAMGRPVVASAPAIEGLPAEDGRNVLVGRNPRSS